MSEESKYKDSVSITDAQPIIVSILDFINKQTVVTLPVKIELEHMADKPPAMCLQQSSGGGKYDYNIVGGCQIDLPFALFVGVNPKQTQDRIDVNKVLNDLGAFFDTATRGRLLPEIGTGYYPMKLELTSGPIMSEAYSNGYEVYEAVYTFTYHQKSQYE